MDFIGPDCCQRVKEVGFDGDEAVTAEHMTTAEGLSGLLELTMAGEVLEDVLEIVVGLEATLVDDLLIDRRVWRLHVQDRYLW